MKKILLSIALFAVSFVSMAQEGFGTNTTEDFFDNRGLIVSRVANNTAAVISPKNGMFMYDLFSHWLKAYMGGVWSDCFGQNEAGTVAAIVAASNDPADGTPSIADLIDIGLTNVTGDQAAYEVAIANANPVPIILLELQAVIDLVNNPPFVTTIVEVTGPNGNIWMDRNLGATQAATSSTDAAAYGYLYQWGRGSDWHESRTSGTTTSQYAGDTPNHGNFIFGHFNWRSTQNDNLWQGVNGLNNPCPAGFRIPTEAELMGLGITDKYTALSSPLKLSLVGARDYINGSLDNLGISGNYWSSSVSGSNARHFNINSFGFIFGTAFRAFGMAVRCIKD